MKKKGPLVLLVAGVAILVVFVMTSPPTDHTPAGVELPAATSESSAVALPPPLPSATASAAERGIAPPTVSGTTAVTEEATLSLSDDERAQALKMTEEIERRLALSKDFDPNTAPPVDVPPDLKKKIETLPKEIQYLIFLATRLPGRQGANAGQAPPGEAD